MPNKILIIDDDIAIVETLKVLLSAVGYEAATAMDGEAGFAKALEMRPDVILLDLYLPGQDGFEVYSRLKNDENTSNSHIIVLSSFAEKPDSLDGAIQKFDIPQDAFLSKPIEPGKLLEKIKKALS
jgi:CheY-like chemotaxis protein